MTTLGGVVGLDVMCPFDEHRTVFWCVVPVAWSHVTVGDSNRSHTIMPVLSWRSKRVGDKLNSAADNSSASVGTCAAPGALYRRQSRPRHSDAVAPIDTDCWVGTDRVADVDADSDAAPPRVASVAHEPPSDSTTSDDGGGRSTASRVLVSTRLPAIVHPISVTSSGRNVVRPHISADVIGLHVLVVDDESTNRRLCERMLKRLKCTVVCLEDGDEVLGELRRCGYLPRCESASNGGGAANLGCGDEVMPLSPSSGRASTVAEGAFRRVDVILMDIMMRRTNGVDVAVELRQMFRDAASAVIAASEGVNAPASSVLTSVSLCDSREDCDTSGSSADSGCSPTSTHKPSGSCAAAHLERCRLPPIVAMTGNTSLQNIETYKRAGFCHVLPKPFDVGGVQSALSLSTQGQRRA